MKYNNNNDNNNNDNNNRLFILGYKCSVAYLQS